MAPRNLLQDTVEYNRKINLTRKMLKSRKHSQSLSPLRLTQSTQSGMRKGWSNWAKYSTDQFVKQVAPRVMCHTEQIENVHYREQVSNVSASVFASRLVDSMDGPVDNTDHDTNNASANVQESTQEEETDCAQEEDNDIPSHTTPQQEGATAGTVSARPLSFSKSERDFICSIFSSKNGKLPESIESDQVEKAIRRSSDFSLYYSRLVKDMGGIDPANKRLTSCIQIVKHRHNTN